MKRFKAVFYFALCLLPAFLGAAIYIVVADSVCHVEPSKQHGQQHEGAARNHAEIDRYRYQGGAEPLPPSLKVAEATPQETQGASQSSHQDAKPERWFTKFSVKRRRWM
jgi:hypothetical protein